MEIVTITTLLGYKMSEKDAKKQKSPAEKLRTLADLLESEDGKPLRRLSDILEDEAEKIRKKLEKEQDRPYHDTNEASHNASVRHVYRYLEGFLCAVSLVYDYFPELKSYQLAKEVSKKVSF